MTQHSEAGRAVLWGFFFSIGMFLFSIGGAAVALLVWIVAQMMVGA